MLTSRSHEPEHSAQAEEEHSEEALPSGVRRRESQALAQGDEEAQVARLSSEWEPEFPDSADAEEIHDQALQDHGQAPEVLHSPDHLESAMGRAANYWHYGEGTPGERVADAAGALAHGIGMAQAFTDGNKRTAYHTTRYFLDSNGYGYLSPMEHDDEEFADHLLGHALGTHTREDTQQLFRSRLPQNERTSHVANILDPIHNGLDPLVFDDPEAPKPKLKHEHAVWIGMSIMRVLEDAGYRDSKKWLTIILTGSLTTYQYSDESDCDVSLWVDSEKFPDWSRAEMIGLMIDNMDGTTLPGTPHVMQCFVVAPNIRQEDLYKPGLRSGLVVWGKNQGQWLVPPERDRVHDVEKEENESYTIALENADKMERLLRYEPDKAVLFVQQMHHRRQRDMVAGKGDFSPSNISWKFLANRGLLPELNDLAGTHY